MLRISVSENRVPLWRIVCELETVEGELMDCRAVTIHKSHDSVHTSVFMSRFGMVLGTAFFLIY